VTLDSFRQTGSEWVKKKVPLAPAKQPSEK
jgi:hypothetical protein